jgi:hypothetical protein
MISKATMLHGSRLATALALLGACGAPNPVGPDGDPSPDRTRLSGLYSNEYYCNAGIMELCQLSEGDPDPAADGIWVEQTLDNHMCFSPSLGKDLDEDGLDDVCEIALASAFAPRLRVGSLDQWLGREEYWAVRPMPGISGAVMIGYFLGYYWDGGCVASGCGGLTSHAGDSETIGVVVQQNSTNNHWEVREAHLSSHTSYNIFGAPTTRLGLTYTVPITALEFLDKPLGRFEVYVAESKHANYATLRDCNAGGFGATDKCTNGYGTNTAESVQILPNRNLGSNANRFLDCVTSVHPTLSPWGQQECFWTGGAEFGGWIPRSWLQGVVDIASGYRSRLEYLGFMP